MFESLLERILFSYFGKWIAGIDKNNLHLGVWSGNVQIENVGLSTEAIDNLNMPVILKYSFIQKLSLKIPWSKLSTMPVEILIENVYAILGPKNTNLWKFTDNLSYSSKIKLI